jgi:hypothetical protein
MVTERTIFKSKTQTSERDSIANSAQQAQWYGLLGEFSDNPRIWARCAEFAERASPRSGGAERA